jgi:hypothetical protein
LTSRYSGSRCSGIFPSASIVRTKSSVEARWVVPAAETTFSSTCGWKVREIKARKPRSLRREVAALGAVAGRR